MKKTEPDAIYARDPLDADEIQALLDPCMDCQADLWEDLSDEGRRDLVDAVNAFRKQFGRTVVMIRLCSRCRSQVEMKEKRERLHSDMMESKAEGIVRCDLWPYLTPWAQARAQNPEAWAMADRYHPDSGSVYLFGPEGVGKTALCRYILGRLALKAPHGVAELNCTELDFRLSQKKKADQWWARVHRTRVLLLDDLSAVEPTPMVVRKLYQLADYRATARLPTLITAQQSLSALYDTIIATSGDMDALAASALRRFRPIKEVRMEGESLRKLLHFNEGTKK